MGGANWNSESASSLAATCGASFDPEIVYNSPWNGENNLPPNLSFSYTPQGELVATTTVQEMNLGHGSSETVTVQGHPLFAIGFEMPAGQSTIDLSQILDSFQSDLFNQFLDENYPNAVRLFQVTSIVNDSAFPIYSGLSIYNRVNGPSSVSTNFPDVTKMYASLIIANPVKQNDHSTAYVPIEGLYAAYLEYLQNRTQYDVSEDAIMFNEPDWCFTEVAGNLPLTSFSQIEQPVIVPDQVESDQTSNPSIPESQITNNNSGDEILGLTQEELDLLADGLLCFSILCALAAPTIYLYSKPKEDGEGGTSSNTVSGEGLGSQSEQQGQPRLPYSQSSQAHLGTINNFEQASIIGQTADIIIQLIGRGAVSDREFEQSLQTAKERLLDIDINATSPDINAVFTLLEDQIRSRTSGRPVDSTRDFKKLAIALGKNGLTDSQIKAIAKVSRDSALDTRDSNLLRRIKSWLEELLAEAREADQNI